MDDESCTSPLMDDEEKNELSSIQCQNNDNISNIALSDLEDINNANDVNLLSENEDDFINPNISLEGMDADTIADYIDEKYHSAPATTWNCQLMFMGKTIDTECIEMDILQFTAGTQYKHTKKRDAECFKVYLHPEKYTSSGGFESTSFEDLSKELSKSQSKKGLTLYVMENVYGK